ncbi:MAG: cell envelope integrity protein CreD [Burkholderiales bacterium]|nr:cell envelope integrity protein CreD [Burkholderiales bacterium]
MQKVLAWKIAVIVLLGLVVQLPIGMVESLTAERKARRDGVVADIARSAAEAQRLAAPVILLPYTHRSMQLTTRTDEHGRTQATRRERVREGWVALLPESLEIDGALRLQTKHRGIYRARLYGGTLELRGQFVLPAEHRIHKSGPEYAWGRARLVVALSDPRGLREGTRIEWDGTALALHPGTAEVPALAQGVHADLGPLSNPAATQARRHSFRITLALRGSQRLDILPLGRTTRVALASDWPHPSFTGRQLPEPDTRVGAEGFAATWSTTHFATNIAQALQGCLDTKRCDDFGRDAYGVAFIEPVDLYLTLERALKYGFLFVGITFAAFFLFEVLARLAIHPVQYALVGVALAVFFLLLLSLAEHLAFALSYAIAALACVALIGFYLGCVLRGARRGLLFAAALGGLYALLYAVLRLEDHALLMGSALVFALLAAAMIGTRRVDWYRVGPAQATPS